jgi:hypothetical protein
MNLVAEGRGDSVGMPYRVVYGVPLAWQNAIHRLPA